MCAQPARPNYKSKNYELPVEEALELARGHHMIGNFTLAERTYKDILKAVPDNATVLHLLGALYYQLSNYDLALEYMEKSIEISPQEVSYLNNYANVLAVSQHFAEAIIQFDKILSLTPQNIEALNGKSNTLWSMKDFENAETVARESLKAAPNNLEALLALGLSLASQKKFEEANESFQTAMEHYSQDSRVFSNAANMLREMHKYGKAEDAARKALEIDKNNIEALNNMGCILSDTGRYANAVEFFTKATDISPKFYQAHLNKALALHNNGENAAAAVSARYAVDFKPDYTDAYNALSSSLCRLGEYDQAQFALQKALQLNPDDAESYINLANLLYAADKFDDGHAAITEALRINPSNARSYGQLAEIYEKLDEVDNAIEAIDKAIELEPKNPAFCARKGIMLHVTNDVEESLKLFDKAIEIAPDFLMTYIAKAEALIAVNRLDDALECIRTVQKLDKHLPALYFTLTSLKKIESEDDEDFKIMLEIAEDRTAQKLGVNQVYNLSYAIAKAYDSMKNYDKACEYYDRASKTRRASLPFDKEKAAQSVTKIQNMYNFKVLKMYEDKGLDTDVPVFIVGMPRSGTTLTEQILSAHPDVYGAGELPDLFRASRLHGGVTPETARDIGETYLEFATERTKGFKAKRITDKMPANFMNIGLIACTMPNAKIVHCTRDPIDTCLSNYKQNFMVGQQWSYDLEEMADEYERYLEMMEFWHELLPGKILDFNYEETVDNLESQARKLIDHVGLEWNDACLEPHKQKRAVLTASKMQVTQPIYKSSVKKWKRYEKHLQPLVRRLCPEEALPIEE